MLAAVTVGSVAQWFTLGVVVFGAWRLTAGGTGSAVTELSKANEVLTHRVQELGAEVRDLRIENERLKGRTDFAAVIAQHEQRAQARADKTLIVLGLIADRLGAEPNGS